MSDGTDRTRPPENELAHADDTIIGRAFWWSIVVVAVIVVTVVAGLLLFRAGEVEPIVIDRDPIEAPPPLVQDDPDMPIVPFRDITREAGIDFVHESGARGEKLLPETMGGGCAFLDYDGDGDQDLLLVNSTTWPGAGEPEGRSPHSALYRNDGTGRFEDVSAAVGLDIEMYGMGAAAADYDNDGDTDVFISALGPNALFENENGVFRNVTDRAGVAGGAADWSTSSGFFDADDDGDLDLFVCSYVEWSRELDRSLGFTLNGTDRAYGPPKQYRGTHCSLYRNDGDGTFADVTAESGIAVTNPATGEPMGKALAVTFADVDDDGDLDVLVANDTVQNFAFRNDGACRFTDLGAVSGMAYDTMGSATGAMGIDAGEFANDGRLGVGIANFANESTSFFVQQDRNPWLFADMSGSEGIGSPSRLKLSFGLCLLDYDLDGRLDLLQANGHLEDEINAIQPSQHYRQPAQLFWNCGPDASACFAAVPEETTGDLARPIVGRGAAYADIDGDGDLDLLLTQTGGAPLLLRNDRAPGAHWLRLELTGMQCNRDAIGALVEVTANGVVQRRRVMPTRSYLSQVERPVTFGLGRTDGVDRIRITWPGGAVQEVADRPVDTTLRIRQPVGRRAGGDDGA